MSEGK